MAEDNKIDPDTHVAFTKTRAGLAPIAVNEDDDPIRDAAGEKVVVDLKAADKNGVRTVGPAAEAPKPGSATVIAEGEFDEDEDEEPLDLNPPAPARVTHSSADIAYALELGIPRSEIEESTPGELRAATRAAARNQRQAPQQPAAPTPEPEFDLGLTREEEELLDPAALAVHKKIAAKLNARSREVEKKLEADRAERQQQAQNTVTQKVHAAFASLKNDELFGSDPSKLSPPQLARRRAVIAVAQTDHTGRSIKAVIRDAVATLYPDATPQSDVETGGKKLSATEARWLAGSTPPPKAKRLAPANTPEGRQKRAEKVIHEKFFGPGTNGAVVNHPDDGSNV